MICPSRQEADKAVNACHNNKTLPGVSATLISVFDQFENSKERSVVKDIDLDLTI